MNSYLYIIEIFHIRGDSVRFCVFRDEYDENCIRTSKTVNGVKHKYVLLGVNKLCIEDMENLKFIITILFLLGQW